MKKLLAVAAFGLAALGPAAGRAPAWFCHNDGCSHYKYNITIYCTPYNAFTPCATVNPLGIPWGNWGPGPWGGPGYCGQGGWDGADGCGGWCGGPAGCLGPVNVVGPHAPSCIKGAFGGDRRSHEPWWGKFCGRKNDGDGGCAPGAGWGGYAGGYDGTADGERGHRCKLFHHRKPEAPANFWAPAYCDGEADCPWDGGMVEPPPAPAKPMPATPPPGQKQTAAPTPENVTPNLTTLEYDPFTNSWPMPR